MYQPQDVYKRSRGFTLVEALVALTLLTVALVPAFIQATSAMQLSVTIRNSLVAADLAQEGVEVMRAMRDANWFAGAPFGSGLDACASGCLVQWNSVAPIPYTPNTPLRFDALTGLYQYSQGDNTLFYRTIYVTEVSVGELAIRSEVTWKDRRNAKSFSVEQHVFDWIQ